MKYIYENKFFQNQSINQIRIQDLSYTPQTYESFILLGWKGSFIEKKKLQYESFIKMINYLTYKAWINIYGQIFSYQKRLSYHDTINHLLRNYAFLKVRGGWLGLQ